MNEEYKGKTLAELVPELRVPQFGGIYKGTNTLLPDLKKSTVDRVEEQDAALKITILFENRSLSRILPIEPEVLRRAVLDSLSASKGELYDQAIHKRL